MKWVCSYRHHVLDKHDRETSYQAQSFTLKFVLQFLSKSPPIDFTMFWAEVGCLKYHDSRGLCLEGLDICKLEEYVDDDEQHNC